MVWDMLLLPYLEGCRCTVRINQDALKMGLNLTDLTSKLVLLEASLVQKLNSILFADQRINPKQLTPYYDQKRLEQIRQ